MKRENGRWELWAVPAAGGEAVRLTHDKWEDGPSDWGFVRVPPYEQAAGGGSGTR
jgi:hypothetical protein